MSDLHSGTSFELTPSNPSKNDSTRLVKVHPETIGSTSSPQIRAKKPPYPLLIPAVPAQSSNSGNRTKPTTPLRTTKTSQKLVLLPEEASIPTLIIEETSDDAETPVTPIIPVPAAWDSTNAERMSKEVRDNKHYPRVTAYCTAEGFYLGLLIDFLKKRHNVHPKLYDECLYAPYHFPLVSGRNSKIASSSAIKSPNGYTFMDRQIENYENINDISHYFTVEEGEASSSTTKQAAPLTNIGEVFYFDYGVVVIWNFTEEQEHLLLHDIDEFRISARPTKKDDIEVETFHFQYDIESNRQPRIFNDMITLKTDNHMIKLTISHAISQSTKLTLYEWQMENTIERTRHIPKMLAQTGRLNLNRVQVTKLSGEMFKLRMNVNLVSNVLAYLEIPQRVDLLNERCSVISDLLDMLREDIGNSNMTRITWIIIWLIVVAVFVAIGEIAVKALYFYG
ncbi:12431_t:CDS:2 [Funneliformis geosporum]|uniref:9479_t:CDS:1 n=1 Tax=Funneliformis geosporum TaxID=1117311 RepID=A0A9W4SC43_9GLOM|nr:9479_t:CDS:2 [Funneliformis geosporum]CAI2164367.1 12431_t:CDS:2 [Funneliformis geosporum]